MLLLCRAAPRAWLQQGKTISVADAPTHFGGVSFQIRSDARNNKITARVMCPTRKSVPVKLRIRHPEAKPIVSVRLNGRSFNGFNGDWITIPAGTKTADVEVSY